MKIIESLMVVSGALLFAAILFGLLAAPGFLFDHDSTVPNSAAGTREAVR